MPITFPGLEGKVAFITGAGRGQGRAHAVRLAESGADIIATDIGGTRIASVPYALASEDDLAETQRLVEKTGRRCLALTADVRDIHALDAAVQQGVAAFGGLDIVIANAGIFHAGNDENSLDDTAAAWSDAIDVMLTGTFNTVRVVSQPLIDTGRGGSIVLISSMAGLVGMHDGSGGIAGYNAAKHGLVGLMRGYAKLLGPHSIRVNSVHPTAVNTPMVMHEKFTEYVVGGKVKLNSGPSWLPGGSLEPDAIADAVLWLVSDAAQHVTGITLPVDSGITLG
jgi:SDR family mycofactocin-dependent oxidoreductase